jgi:hypothetical protein
LQPKTVVTESLARGQNRKGGFEGGRSRMEAKRIEDGRWKIEDGARHKRENLTAKNAEIAESVH